MSSKSFSLETETQRERWICRCWVEQFKKKDVETNTLDYRWWRSSYHPKLCPREMFEQKNWVFTKLVCMLIMLQSDPAVGTVDCIVLQLVAMKSPVHVLSGSVRLWTNVIRIYTDSKRTSSIGKINAFTGHSFENHHFKNVLLSTIKSTHCHENNSVCKFHQDRKTVRWGEWEWWIFSNSIDQSKRIFNSGLLWNHVIVTQQRNLSVTHIYTREKTTGLHLLPLQPISTSPSHFISDWTTRGIVN